MYARIWSYARKRDGLRVKMRCVRLSALSAVKIQRENVAGGNDEGEFSSLFHDAAHIN